MNATLRRLLLFLAAAHLSLCRADQPYRFLFIVDTSLSMAAQRPATQRAIRSLVNGAVATQAQDGDTLGLWLFNEENTITPVHADWGPSTASTIGDGIAELAALAKHEKRGRFDAVAGDLQAAISSATNMLVFVITDGRDPITGTAHDAQINAELAGAQRKLRQARRPAVIALRVDAGSFVEARVFADGQFEDVPVLPKPSPAPPQTPLPESASVVSNDAAASVVQVEKPNADPPPVFELPPGARIVPPPAIETPEAVSEPPEVAAEPAKEPALGTEAVTLAEAATNLAVHADPPDVPKEMPGPADAPAAIVDSSTDSNGPAASGPVGSVSQTSQSTQTISSAREPATRASQGSMPAAVVRDAPWWNWVVYLLGGAAVLVSAAILVVLMRKKPAVPGSLISQSITSRK